MGGWLDRPGYFKGVENFSDGVKVFWEIENFQVGGLMLFHNGWGNFRVVETFTRSDVFFVFLEIEIFFFLMAGRGKADIFPVSHGIKIFPVTWVSCQGVRDFSGGGRGGNFFSGGNSVFGGRLHLKISILWWRSLSCILQNALNCSLK